MATALRTSAVTPLAEGLAERAPRRRRSASPGEEPTDRTHWTVIAGDDVTDVASRASAWSAAIGAYTPGHSVSVRSTL